MGSRRQVSSWYYVAGLIIACLIAVQIYWIRNAIKLQQKELERDLREDLITAVKEVEESAYCFNLYSKAYIRKGEGIYLIKQQQQDGEFIPNGYRDTLDIYGVFYMPEDTIFEYDNAATFTNYSATVDINYKFTFTGAEGMRLADTGSYNTEGLTAQNFKERLRHKNAFYIIDTTLLDKYIKNVLAENKLDTVYQAGIQKQGSNGWEYLKDGAKAKNLSDAPIQIQLLNDRVSEPYMLHILVPNSFSKTIQSVLVMLVSSLLIILILIVSYTYFIRQFLNQKKLSEMKDSFINNITHEFRTPITNINLAVENWCESKQKGEQYVKIIEEENKHLERNVEQILQLATLEHAKHKLQKEKMDMHELILEAVDSFAIQLEHADGKVEYELNATDPYIFADRQQIKNMLLNLIDNAIKYRKGPPVLTIITASVNAKKFELQIEDNGIGMDADTLKHIFNRFYRSNTGDRHDVKGFGLGLSYVKYIVDAHKGEIHVKSKPEKGTTFTIQLPKEYTP